MLCGFCYFLRELPLPQFGLHDYVLDFMFTVSVVICLYIIFQI